VRCI